MIYMFLSNNPSSGDINSSNLPCFYLQIWNFSFENWEKRWMFWIGKDPGDREKRPWKYSSKCR